MRNAAIYLSEIRVCCPFCEEPVYSNEEDSTWNKCVGGETGEHSCSECGKKFLIPETLYAMFGRRLRVRK